MALTAVATQWDLDTWSRQVGQALDAGKRLVTLFGRFERVDSVITTAVLRGADGRLGLLRGRGPGGGAYPSITVQHACAQVFERELWEQTGLTPAGHPWLKPVRYEGCLLYTSDAADE